MSSAATSLEEELNIPQEATLQPSSSSWSIQTNTGASVSIAQDTAIRSSPRCLIVGRQAKVSDIRIQHGSISRKHAALYFLQEDLILHDFGSKKGTQVNGTLVQGQVKLKEGDEIMFGNVRESIFRVHCERKSTEIAKPDNNHTNNENGQQEETQNNHDGGHSTPVADPGAGLTGRAKREAEIAAMMDSLEQTPTYQKYIPSAEEVAAERQAQKAATTKATNVTEDAPLELLDSITKAAKENRLPIAERMTFTTESERRQMVTCVAMDPSGARFAVGSTDNTLRLYDFGGMDQLKRDPFKMLQADEGHVVSDICYSNTGDRLIVGTGSSQPHILDRDGGEIIKFVKGDMYVLDQAKTTGHTASVTGVQWHPLERDTVLTSSIDGSARLWNLNGKTQFEMLVCDKVFQPKSSKGQRTNVLCVAYHPGGREFAVGTSCGSIQIWNTSRVSGRPERSVFDAHGRGKPINAIVYNYDGSALSSRSSEDDTCKVWDTRIITSSASPLVICKDAATFSEHSSMDFNCNGKIICVGTALRTKTKDGKLRESGGIKFFHVPKSSSSQPNQSEAFLSLDVSGVAGVTVVKWHPKLNEILIGFSDGKTDVLFDPQLSSKGALLPFTKAGRKGDALSELLKSRAPTGSAGVRGQIIAPNAIAIGHGTKRKRGKEEDPSRSRIPEPPAAGLKTGTQSGGGVNFTQFIVDSRMKSSKSIAGKDPREELLKYNEGESYVSKAYEGNTERILADKTVEQEEEELALSKKKRTQK